MAKNLKFPYEGKSIENEVVTNYTINKVINLGQVDESKKNFIIISAYEMLKKHLFHQNQKNLIKQRLLHA